MANIKTLTVPDLGDISQAKVTEVLVKLGDTIESNQSIISIESDKAIMEVPSEYAGCIKTIDIKAGQVVQSGGQLMTIELSDLIDSCETQSDNIVQSEQLLVPDLGGTQAKLIEWLVQPGDSINQEQSVCVLESDKATMEIPASLSGTVESLDLALGVDVQAGVGLLTLKLCDQENDKPVTKILEEKNKMSDTTTATREEISKTPVNETSKIPYAGPAVRKLATLLSIDLNQISGSGNKGRITKQDLLDFVKMSMQTTAKKPQTKRNHPNPADFGPVVEKPFTRIKKLSAEYLHHNWQSIPHVTQCIDAEVTDFEAYRKQCSQTYKPQGIRMTPLVFIMKALVLSLKQHEQFNASLSEDESSLILKSYYHIGVAVDTPNGLVVPVVQDVDKKSIVDLATELGKLSQQARAGSLKPSQMRGQSFTISSLGGIGGNYFTPIINAPDVAILGISQMQTKPVWSDNQWLPKLFLPLSLSYDHRVIDGAEAARFMVDLSNTLSTIHTLIHQQ